jgi:hypothetical protein
MTPKLRVAAEAAFDAFEEEEVVVPPGRAVREGEPGPVGAGPRRLSDGLMVLVQLCHCLLMVLKDGRWT